VLVGDALQRVAPSFEIKVVDLGNFDECEGCGCLLGSEPASGYGNPKGLIPRSAAFCFPSLFLKITGHRGVLDIIEILSSVAAALHLSLHP